METLAKGLSILRELTPRTSDFLVARGERISARLVTAALQAATEADPSRAGGASRRMKLAKLSMPRRRVRGSADRKSVV